MKKLLAAAGLGAAVTIGSLVGAGTASASPSGFINAVHNEGISAPAGNTALYRNGYLVCQWLDQGYSVRSVINEVYYASDFPSGTSGGFVGISVRELCPRHTNTVLNA